MSAGTPSHRRRDEQFRLVADSLPLLVWISGPDKRCTYFNKPWLDFTGRPLEAELGDGWARRGARRRSAAVPGHLRPRLRSS